MSSEWQETTLQSLLTFANGKSSPARFDNAKFAVFGSNGLIGKANEFNSPANSIVVGRVGSYCGAVHFSSLACWVTDNAIKATAKDGNDPLFLFYLLKQINLNNWRSGSGQPLINQSTLNSIEVRVPLQSEQRRIGEFVAALDDRISLLCETNATLEAIAQALFKSWFVDFDPVRAKIEGRAPEGIDEATAVLFPDSFEQSELGLVPKGWRVGKLEDLLVLQRGFDLPAADRVDGTYPIIAASGPAATHNVAMAKAPGVITGRSGVLGRVFLAMEDYWPLNTTLWVKEFRAASSCYAYELLKRLDFASFNAGSAVPTLNRNHVHSLPYLIPPREYVDAYELVANALHSKVRANQEQARTLANLRDTLLPRLISGQLRLSEN